MRPKRVTMDDVARRLRLSKCTVSRVLNRAFDGFTYAPATIRRVEKVARRMGYQPNTHARALRTRRSHLIGLALPTGSLPFFGILTECLEVELRAAGYQVLVAHSRNDPNTEREVVRSLVARGVDGLLWIPVRTRFDARALGLDPLFPVVLMDRPGISSRLPLVATDNRAATRELAHRLLELGHTAVAAFNAPKSDRSMVEREEGLREVLRQGLFVLNMDNEPGPARAAVDGLLAPRRRFTALVALSEPLAIGALAGLRDAGRSIPGELSFAAFDDFPLASHWTPPITVMRQDLPRIAAAATAALLSRLRDPSSLPPSVRIPAVLEWRESIAQVHSRR